MSFESYKSEETSISHFPKDILERIPEKHREIFEAAAEVPPIQNEVLDNINMVLGQRENLIDNAFGEFIGPLGMGVSEHVQLLPTTEFVQKYADDPSSFGDLYIDAIPAGYRSFYTGEVLVHTTNLVEKQQVKPEVILIRATHEMMHGKVVPKIEERKDDEGNITSRVRHTGCKVIETKINDKLEEVVDVIKHAEMYEAQTDILAMSVSISKEDFFKNKDPYEVLRQVSHVYAIRGSSGYLDAKLGLINVLNTAYPDFVEEMNFLGSSYFKCESEEFFSTLKSRVVESSKYKEQAIDLLDRFIDASKRNDERSISELGEEIKSLERSDEKSSKTTLSPEVKSRIADYNLQDFEKAAEVPPLSEAEIEKARVFLTDVENFVDRMFGEYIDPQGRGVAEKVNFLPTSKYLEEYAKNFPHSNIEAYGLPVGFRGLHNGAVILHTTDMYNLKNVEMGTSFEMTAIHEMMHGKVVPLIQETDTGISRRTGCKNIFTSKEGRVSVTHGQLYEAQTEVLASFSYAQEGSLAKSEDPYDALLLPTAIHGYSRQCRSLVAVLESAYPNFNEGMGFLGKNYFKCEGLNFRSGLSERIIERSADKTAARKLLYNFWSASENDEVDKMLDVANQIKLLEKI
jgi:hypothetical protein